MAFGDPDFDGTGPVGGRTGNESNREGPDYSGWDDQHAAESSADANATDPSAAYGKSDTRSAFDKQMDVAKAKEAFVFNKDLGYTSTGHHSTPLSPVVSGGSTNVVPPPTGVNYNLDFLGKQLARAKEQEAVIAKDTAVKDAWDGLKAKHSQTQTKNFLGLFDYKGSVHSKHQKEKDVQAFVDKYGKHLDDMGKRNTRQAHAYGKKSAQDKQLGSLDTTPKKTGIEGIIEGVMKGINPASMLMGLIGGPFAGIATTLASSIPQYQPTQIEQELEQMQKDLGMIEPDQGDVQIPQHRQIILCNLKPGMRWDVASGSCVPSAADEENPIDTHSPN